VVVQVAEVTEAKLVLLQLLLQEQEQQDKVLQVVL
jgi:hypothetical protein